MKKTFLSIVLLTFFLSAHCQTAAEKTAQAKIKYEQAKENLKQARMELNATYPAYKQEAKDQIKGNDQKITEIRGTLNNPKNASVNETRKKQIDSLESVNVQLRDRLFIVNE